MRGVGFPEAFLEQEVIPKESLTSGLCLWSVVRVWKNWAVGGGGLAQFSTLDKTPGF